MRLVATADFHGRGFPEIPPCDLLLIAGDWSPVDEGLDRWLRTVLAGEIVAIAGNADYAARDDLGAVRDLPWTFLHDETVVVDGLTIHGSPWSKKFSDFPFTAEDRELARYWDLIPDDCDVLMTHGPGYGFGDLAQRVEHVGSRTLNERIRELPKLKLHVCGHIHEAFGVWSHRGVLRANAAYVDGPEQPVLAFDYDGKTIVQVTA